MHVFSNKYRIDRTWYKRANGVLIFGGFKHTYPLNGDINLNKKNSYYCA
ncbi:MAG: hypothetical protein ACXIT9_01015 [Nitritalea sp.]